MKMHPDITENVILEACKRHRTGLDDPGFCIACGQEQGVLGVGNRKSWQKWRWPAHPRRTCAANCEPDMHHGLCERCGEQKVYGAEELMEITL